MLAPRPRHHAPSSTISTILDTSPSSRSSSPHMRPGRASTSTSWSDNGTEIPRFSDTDKDHDYETMIIEEERKATPPLIDFGDGLEMRQEQNVGRRVGETPGDKLRLLLRQMEAEVRSAVPVEPVVEDESKGVWRNGRRRGFERNALASGSRSRSPESSPERRPSEEESPPTPPPRITRPYSIRRTSADTRPATSARIPSRAAVLHASTSTSQSPPPSPRRQPRTPLETFIATHPKPTIPLQSSSPSMDRSRSSISSSGSRKGKERAAPRSYPLTPRQRTTVEEPPDTSELFVMGVEEAQRDVDLDLAEESDAPPWEETEESAVNEAADIESPEPQTSMSRIRNLSSRELETSRTTRSPTVTNPRRAENVLPALPEPEVESTDEEEPESPAIRRRSFFRSPSKSTPGRTPIPPVQTHPSGPDVRTSTIIPKISPARNIASSPFRTIPLRDMVIPPQEPIRVGMVLDSTPSRSTPLSNTQIGNGTIGTPKPPGGWKFTPGGQGKNKVRFIPRTSHKEEGEVSVHRIKLSPAQPKTLRTIGKSPLSVGSGVIDQSVETPELEMADTSFSGRLKGISRALTGRPLPPPSTTLRQAQAALDAASAATKLAQDRLENSQRQWLDALSSISISGEVRDATVAVVKTSWGWGNWCWWFAIEVLLVWSVFRLTLDYATSSTYLSSFDPFHPSSQLDPLRLGMNLPILAPFQLDHRGSSNLFDLLERYEIWRKMGVQGGMGDHGRLMGVPT